MKNKIIPFIAFALGSGFGAIVVFRIMREALQKKNNLVEKHFGLFQIMQLWFRTKQKGKSVSSFFENYSYHTVAVYGAHYLGECLVEELKGSGINVKYAIDKNITSIQSGIPVIKPDEVLEPVDLIVVTAIFYYDEIVKSLENKVNCPIVSLEDVLEDIFYE